MAHGARGRRAQDSRTYWFNAGSLEAEDAFMLVGLVLGLAIYNAVLLDFPLPLALYRKLLGQPAGLRDLQDMDPTLGKSLRQLLEYEGARPPGAARRRGLRWSGRPCFLLPLEPLCSKVPGRLWAWRVRGVKTILKAPVTAAWGREPSAMAGPCIVSELDSALLMSRAACAQSVTSSEGVGLRRLDRARCQDAVASWTYARAKATRPRMGFITLTLRLMPRAGPGSVADTFCLSFEAGVPGIGEPISLALRGDGSEPVTEDNRRAYVDAYVDCVLNTSIHKQARAARARGRGAPARGA